MTWTIGKDVGVVSHARGNAQTPAASHNDYGVPRDGEQIPEIVTTLKTKSGSVFDDFAGNNVDDHLTRFFPSESRAVFESLLFELPMMVMALDDKGDIVNANQAVLNVLGYTAREIIGHQSLNFLASVSRKLLREKVLPQLFETGRFSNIDVELIKKDGTSLEMMMSSVAHKNADGRIAKSIVVFTDMSQRANAQAALRQSEQRFRESFESAAHGMAILTADGRIAAANVALIELFGKSELELSRKPLASLVDEGEQDKLQAMYGRVNTGQHSGVNAELRFVGGEGRSIYGLTSISAVRNSVGQLEQMIVQIVDLTHRHKAEEQLRKAQKMEAVGQLTGGIAHDFNNLLTVIIGNLQLVERALEGNEKAGKRAREAIDAATKGSDLTRQLLAFARRQSLAPQEVDVNELIANMGSMLTRSIGGSAELKIDLMDGNPKIKVDPTQLESSLLNLAINARDAMPKGGRLTIETSEAYLDEAYASEHEEVEAGNYILIAVSDTGSGIPAHILEKIFQPFFTTKEVGKGTGLGLSMVFGFIKQSGGHVRVYSEEGHGTSFKLYLPRTDEMTDAVAETDAGEAKKKILVVDDQEAVRMVAVDFLQEFGYEVLEAGDGVAALQILQDVPDIALLFTDVVMPGTMNGFDLSQAAEQIRPDLKIVHASGYPKGAMVHQEEPRLKDNLISKPFRREELRKVVRETLGDELD